MKFGGALAAAALASAPTVASAQFDDSSAMKRTMRVLIGPTQAQNIEKCIGAQAARFERLESRLVDAADLTLKVGCAREIDAAIASVPQAKSPDGAPRPYDQDAEAGRDLRKPAIITTFAEPALLAVTAVRERRLASGGKQ